VLVVNRWTLIARDIHRKRTSDQDLNAKEILAKLGMQVTERTPQQVEAFRNLAQPPVKDSVEKDVGKDLVADFEIGIGPTHKSLFVN